MENFEFMSPTKFVFEKDADLRCGEFVKKVSNNVLFVHYGDGFTYESGLHKRIVDSFTNNGVEVFELPGVEPNPKVALVNEGISLCKKNSIGYVVAVGGGSVIDTAKAVAMGAMYDGDVWDFYTKKAELKNALPIGVVMTLPATGSEASNGSVMNDGVSKENLDVMSDLLRPSFALLNPELTYGIPKRQTGYGVIDMFTHVVERYMSTSKNVDLTDRMCEAVMQSIVENGYQVMDNPKSESARSDLMWAAIVAHNGVLGVGRNQDWATHAIAAQLSANYNTVHAASLSVIMPNWARYILDDYNVDRFVQFANRVFRIDIDFYDKWKTAHAGINAMQKFFVDMGGPTTMSEIEVGSELFSEMASSACKFGSIGGIKQLNKSDVEEIYRKSM